MADERKHTDPTSGEEERLRDAVKKAGRTEPLGRGMTSPDSTEAVLSAETGEPDPRARNKPSNGGAEEGEA